MPEENSEAEKLRRKAPWFWLSEDRKLYKYSFSGPYLLCVHLEASKSFLEEQHEGICGSHTGGKLYLIEPLFKDIGGRACKGKHKNMLKNVISVRNLRQTFISLEEFLILFLALGLSPNGA